MATVFTHAFVGLVTGRLLFPTLTSWKLTLFAIGCSALPDLDTGLHAYGVRYEDAWGHRGMMHSILFAVLVGLVVTCWPFRREAPFLTRRWWALFAFFSAITASHGLIDMFTDGGLGIAILAPFDATRYFMPWRPLAVPDLGVAHLFTKYTGHVLITELLWVWLPLTAIALPVSAVRRRRARPGSVRSPVPGERDRP